MYRFTPEQQQEWFQGREDAKAYRAPREPSTQPYRDGYESIIEKRTEKENYTRHDLHLNGALQQLENMQK